MSYEREFVPGLETYETNLKVRISDDLAFEVFDVGPGAHGERIMAGRWEEADFRLTTPGTVLLATPREHIEAHARAWARHVIPRRLARHYDPQLSTATLADAAGCAFQAALEAFEAACKVRLLGDQAFVVTPLGPARFTVRAEVLGGAESAPAGHRWGWLPPVTAPTGRLSLAEAERRAVEVLPWAYPEDAHTAAMMPLDPAQVPEKLGVRAGFLCRAVVRAAREVFA